MWRCYNYRKPYKDFYMKVTNIRYKKLKDFVIFSADFIIDKIPQRRRQYIMRILQNMVKSVFIRNLDFIDSLKYRKTIWFKVPLKYATINNFENSFFACAVPLAYALNEDLYFDGPVSTKMYRHAQKIAPYFDLKTNISIKVKKLSKQSKSAKGMAQCFTLGVDSFYTLAEFSEISKKYFLFIDGFDVPLNKKPFLNIIHQNILKVAKETNNIPIFVRSNLKELSDKIMDWRLFHSAGIFAAANFSSGFINTLYYNSSDGFLKDSLKKKMRHQNLSSEYLTYRTYGVYKNRIDKIKRIQRGKYYHLFKKYARFCFENINKKNISYNCLQCEKCIRTFYILKIHKVVLDNTIFKIPTVNDLEKIRITPSNYNIWQEIYKKLLQYASFHPEERDFVDRTYLFLRRNKVL